MAQILDGKATAQQWQKDTADDVKLWLPEFQRRPCLAVVWVGDNPASATYVRNKEKDCELCGIDCSLYHLKEDATTDDVTNLVRTLNRSALIDGIIVQLPLPNHIWKEAVLATIDPNKDVDGLHPNNLGRLMSDDTDMQNFTPCTPLGVIALLQHYGIKIRGKHCVVVGRSALVGKPLSQLLLGAGGTVTVCHSGTKELSAHTLQADILISATGVPNLITADMVKPDAVVVDVGITRGDDGKLHGDVDFEAVSQIASFITPVPGGVGPMTRAALMSNVFEAWCRNATD